MIPRRCSIWASIRHFSSEFSEEKNICHNYKRALQFVNKRHNERERLVTWHHIFTTIDKYANTRIISIHLFAICRERSFVTYGREMSTTTTKDGGASTHKMQNKLAFEKSPYLQQHATNPVQWFPWGDEAIEKARREDKLIFLSVGYSTCHWCHVMERESFENHDIAKVMNQFFVNIKVDREERPDIDKIYMTFIQVRIIFRYSTSIDGQ